MGCKILNFVVIYINCYWITQLFNFLLVVKYKTITLQKDIGTYLNYIYTYLTKAVFISAR